MRTKRHATFALAAAALAVAGCQGGEESTNAAGGAAAAEKSEAGQSTIGQSLAQSADHSTLTSAVKSAGLEGTLNGAQPYTLFAPTNAAFQKVPNGQALLQPDQKGQLTGILTYHIVPGVVTAEDLSRAIERGDGKAEIATMGGTNLTASKEGDTIVISDAAGGKARVTQADLTGSNGVVHSIDTVLTPGQASAGGAQ